MALLLATDIASINGTTEMIADEEELSSLSISYSSVLGTRSNQQDSLGFEISNNTFLGAVFDGMGGMNGGELASSTACRLMMNEFREEAPISNVHRFYDNMVKLMGREVSGLKGPSGKTLGGGTTCVSIHIQGDHMDWLNVGDSRLYIIRDKKMVQITRDHNYGLLLNQYLNEGTITKDEYIQRSAKKEALISFIGGNTNIIDLDSRGIPLVKGDIMILCSDGLYKALSMTEITNLIDIFDEDFELFAPYLTRAVLRYGQPPLDNCTILAVRYEG